MKDSLGGKRETLLHTWEEAREFLKIKIRILNFERKKKNLDTRLFVKIKIN